MPLVDRRVDVDAGPADAGGVDLLRHDLREVHGLGLRLQHPGLDPRHVQQVRDQHVQPVGLRVDRAEHLELLVLRTLDLRIQQIRDRGLDRRERAPKVVRDGGEHAPADLIGLPEDLRLRRGAQETVALQHERELVAHRPDHPALGSVQRRPLADEHDQAEVPPPDAERQSLGGPARRARIPRRRDRARLRADGHEFDESLTLFLHEQGPGVEPELPHEVLQQRPVGLLARTLHHEVAAELLERAQLGLPCLGCVRPFGRACEQDRDQDREPQEHEERRHVFRALDHERSERRQEEEVEDEEAFDRGDDARSHAPEGCGDHDDDHEGEPDGARPQAVAERHEHEGERDRADHGDHVAGDAPLRASRLAQQFVDPRDAHDMRIGIRPEPHLRVEGGTASSKGIPNVGTSGPYGSLIPPD